VVSSFSVHPRSEEERVWHLHIGARAGRTMVSGVLDLVSFSFASNSDH